MKKIMIDPGHGGSDPGATTSKPWPLRECDIAWAVSMLVRFHLEIAPEGQCEYEALHSRRQGQDLDPYLRAISSRAVQADAFVSIHCNSVEDPSAHGVEVLHYGSPEGVRLAESIYSQLPIEKYALRGRGLKERKDLIVLNSTHCPATLVELPFLSNPAEAELMTDARFQNDFAAGIARGICKYFE